MRHGSLAALQNGMRPTHDPKGKPLKNDSPFFLEKGAPLANGPKGIFWVIQGDHEWFRNSLKLPFWASHNPCWECTAKKNPVPAKMWYKTHEKGKQWWNKITHEEALKKAPSGHRLFSGVIPGLSTKMVRGDCLHIFFTKEVLGHLLGSILHYFLWFDGVGVAQAVPPQRIGWAQSFKLYSRNM
jgi:hypothetical protein